MYDETSVELFFCGILLGNIHASPIISVSLPAVLEGVFFAQEQCLIANKLTKDLYLFYSLLIISIKLLDMRDVHNKWN